MDRLRRAAPASEETLRESAAEYGVERTYTDHHAMLEREPLDALFLLIPPTCHTDVELLAANDNTLNPSVGADGSVPLYTDSVLYAGLVAGDYYLAVSSSGNDPPDT